ncbi:MAG TPA: RES family NAD+ phosphorylase [Bauldia sp.]|nr:RES family NAD+ phosphorylase [Bauldia sp.]
MRLWRISNHVDLSGEGGRRAAGRWSHQGRRVVYLAEHPALAMLETLVHLEVDVEDLPSTYRLIEVEAPDELSVTTLAGAMLDRDHPGWATNAAITQELGAAFLSGHRDALLRVPSVLVPESANYLLNPEHADAPKVRIVGDRPVAFDRRLFG